jgi:hypothetical protein
VPHKLFEETYSLVLYNAEKYPKLLQKALPQLNLKLSFGVDMDTLLICGLTPAEYIRLNGSLPLDVQLRLAEGHCDFNELLRVSSDVAIELEEQAYINHECFDNRRIAAFLSCVRGLHGLV